MKVLQPPNEQSPEGWLSTMDATPTLVPVWPESLRMALVCVYLVSDGEDRFTEAAVILSEREVDEVHATREVSNYPRLFFLVPRYALLKSPDICPGLTAESWSQ